MKTAGEPVAHRAEEFIIFPPAVAKNTVPQTFADGIKNTGGGGEIHVGDRKGQQVGYAKTVGDVIPLRAPGTVTVDLL
jgi:hypothetical protein